MKQGDVPALDRRAFFKRLGISAGTALAALTAGVYFHDPRGPTAESGEAAPVRIPDYSRRDKSGPAMAIVRGADRETAVNRALAALGGMETYVKKGDRVLLKVNAAFAVPPMLCATTHPDLVAVLTRMCLAAGASRVRVTDNPINDPESCFALSGIGEAARRAGANLLIPSPKTFRPVTIPGAKHLADWSAFYTDAIHNVDKVIGIAPVKDHHRSGASMSMKNWYGLLGGPRNLLHQEIHRVIADLSIMIRPSLIVLDGTQTMMKNGPTGGALSDLKETRTMIVSTDPVAADAFGATLLEKTPADLPHLQLAEAAGSGVVDYKTLSPLEINVSA